MPAEVFALKHLEVLDLSFTAIREVPAEIGRLKKLRELRLFGCPLKRLPEGPALAIDYGLYRHLGADLDRQPVVGLRFQRDELAALDKLTHSRISPHSI